MTSSGNRQFQDSARDSRPACRRDYAIHAHIVNHAREQARLAGFGFIEPPTFEQAELFARGVGRGHRHRRKRDVHLRGTAAAIRLALRPEGTASVCRAYLQHGMANQTQPVKLAYHLPIFRYERPQAGRFRQHTQFGVEAIGVRDPRARRRGHRPRLASRPIAGPHRPQDPAQQHRRHRGSPRLRPAAQGPLFFFSEFPTSTTSPPTIAPAGNEPRCVCSTARMNGRSPTSPVLPLITDHLRPESAAYYESVKSHLEAFDIPL